MVKDGATIILGGLMRGKEVKSITKVPVLADIPFLGTLFRSQEKTLEKTELVILLTPTIVTGEEAIPPRLIERVAQKEQPIPKEPSIRERLGEILFPPIEDISKQYVFKEAEKALERIEQADTFNEYYLSLSERLMQYVAENYIGLGIEGDVQVFFTLKSDGTLIGEPVVVGEVDPYLKNLAIQCVKSAGPYPRFPTQLAEPKHTFNILLSFSG